MKKYFDGGTSMEDLKDAILQLKRREDKRGLYIFISVVTAILVAIIIGSVACLLKKKLCDCDCDWDCDWDEFDEDGCVCEDGVCCCTDSDVDSSVKVEKF